MVRILSDLHFGYQSSRVRYLRQLAPLLEGAGRVLFNGDSVEMLFVEDRESAVAHVETLRRLCAEAGAEPVFLTGNHDPVISATHHVGLAGGAVLVTHGDAFFRGLSPWSAEAPLLRAAHARELAVLDSPADLDGQLHAARRAALAIEGLGAKFRRYKKAGILSSIARQFWPPGKPFYIAQAWCCAARLAGAFAAQYAPQARFIVAGHTHRSGVWRTGGRVVINTGGFTPLAHPLAVELEGEVLTVRRISTGTGDFRLGQVVARYLI